MSLTQQMLVSQNHNELVIVMNIVTQCPAMYEVSL